ncbi:38208_t:CDS:2, partial [Gigaspora margarita]
NGPSDVISLFFEKIPYEDWGFPKCLNFLESKCSLLRTDDRQLCEDEFKSHLHSIINHQSISKTNTRLYNSMEEIFNSKEVSAFFERMDVKINCLRCHLVITHYIHVTENHSISQALEESKRELLTSRQKNHCLNRASILSSETNSISEAPSTGEAPKRKREEEQEVVDPSDKSFRYLFGTDVQCSENMKSICQTTLVPYLKELDDR